MAMLLGSKWSAIARRKVGEAIELGLVPREAEYSLVEGSEGGCTVMVYERSGGRSSKSGSTSFFAFEWASEDGEVTVSALTSLAKKPALT
jgi:hypothetical protein